jgi:hypothetical protein
MLCGRAAQFCQWIAAGCDGITSDMPPDEEDDDLDALVDPESITHPVFQDLPDGMSEDWTHGVVIGGMATETSDIVVAEAYWWAAQQLIEPALRSKEAFLYSYPILFLIRHALELYLKAILQPPKLDHNLVPLIEELDRLMQRQFGQKIPPVLRADLVRLASIDPNGMSFRYTMIKSKQGGSWVSLEGEYWVPLENLRRRMAVIFEGLQNVDRRLRGLPLNRR